jgi:hypothetical protein
LLQVIKEVEVLKTVTQKEVPMYVDRVVEVPVAVPVIQERVVEVPVERLVEVEKIVEVERIVKGAASSEPTPRPLSCPPCRALRTPVCALRCSGNHAVLRPASRVTGTGLVCLQRWWCRRWR